jgi:hypothetical protein
MGWAGDAWDWTKDAFADAADSDFSWVDVAVPFYGATHAAMKGIKAGGNAIGAQIGGSDDNFKPYAAADPTGYSYGGDPNNPNATVNAATHGAMVTAANANYLGNQATQFGQDASLQGEKLLARRTADARKFDQRAVQQGDWSPQNATLGTLGGLESNEGPSAAQAQLQQGTNQALSSQLALARSGRGFGGNAAAMGLAQGNAAGIQANQANQSAALRAQENAAWRGRQGQNLTNIAGMQGQQSQADLGAAVQSRGQNDAMYQGMLGMGQNAWQTGVGAGLQGYGVGMQGFGTSLDAQRLVNDIRGQEMAGNLAQEDAKLRAWAAENGYELQQQQISDQKDAATISALSTMGAAALKGGGGSGDGGGGGGGGNTTRSDIRAKKNVVPDQGQGSDFARGLDFFDSELYRPSNEPPAGVRGSSVPSRIDTESQALSEWASRNGLTPMQRQHMSSRQVTSGGQQVELRQPDYQALDAVREAPGSFYEYKNPSEPGAAPGQHYGPMAQDLAKTPAGASAVVKQPDGSLGVDTDRLTLVNTGALAAQQEEIDKLTAQLDALLDSQGKDGGAAPSFKTDYGFRGAR